jgi:hypothetical protein
MISVGRTVCLICDIDWFLKPLALGERKTMALSQRDDRAKAGFEPRTGDSNFALVAALPAGLPALAGAARCIFVCNLL